MDNTEPNFKPGDKWKTPGIILISLVMLLAAGLGFFVWKSAAQQGQIDDLNNKVKRLEDTEKKADNAVQEDTVQYASHTTAKGLVFDYPKSWSIKEESGHIDSHLTTITTEDGYKMFLLEGLDSMGGTCEGMPPTTVHKEADSRINGMTVVSYGSFIGLSMYDGKYDVPVDTGKYELCLNQGSPELSFIFENAEPLNGGSNDEKLPNQTERPEIIKMLASLRKQ